MAFIRTLRLSYRQNKFLTFLSVTDISLVLLSTSRLLALCPLHPLTLTLPVPNIVDVRQ